MRSLVITLLVGLLSAGWADAGEERHAHAEVPSDPRFEFLKQLAGSWTGPPMEPGQPPLAFEFRVTAGGHAVEEREMIGTPMEMLTVYHMEGSELVGTHFCMLGNRPLVKAARTVVDRTLRFDCDGTPGGAASHDEEHVHGWTMKLDDAGRLHYGAELVKAGKVTESPQMVLTRATKAVSR